MQPLEEANEYMQGIIRTWESSPAREVPTPWASVYKASLLDPCELRKRTTWLLAKTPSHNLNSSL